MNERVFIDTSVPVYADDLDAGEKRTKAMAILRQALETGTGVLSTQVLQEFFVITTRKLGVESAVARRKVELLACLDVVRIDPPRILEAIDLCRLHSLAFWDALVLRSARVGGCARLLSEDLQDGRVIDGVRIENPFRGL